MANTDAQNDPQKLQAGLPQTGGSKFYLMRNVTDEQNYPVVGEEGVPPPTVGQLWPRGDRLST